jgi:hypothetical protein
VKQIFIIGCPRSGTTLVQKLLGAHNDVYSCKETHYFKRIRRNGIKKVLDYLYLSQDNVRSAYEFISDQNQFVVKHDPDGVTSFRSACHFLDRIMTAEARYNGKDAWVEKTPAHVFHIRLIERYIPSATFIHVIRDGRDTVASLVDASRRYPQASAWKDYADLETAIENYNRYLKESMKHFGKESHIFVQYEQIIDNAERVTQNLYTSLGLLNENQCLDLDRVHTKVVRSDEGWKNSSESEIIDTRLVKYNRIFDDVQKEFIVRRISKKPDVFESI